MSNQTLGEYRVGIDFNPSNDGDVAQLKEAAARFIDLVDAIALPEDDKARAGEIARLKALACTNAEDAAMWAVKAVTKPARR